VGYICSYEEEMLSPPIDLDLKEPRELAWTKDTLRLAGNVIHLLKMTADSGIWSRPKMGRWL
jgi:hypothetical protein